MKNQLKMVLEHKNITQKDLADSVDSTQAAISHYIKGNRIPNGITMLKIANFLNLDVRDIWEI